MQWLILIILVPYLYLLLRIYLNLLKITPYHPGNNPGIFVSVIVACRDEEKDLPLLLSDLSRQNYPADKFELIIVDDNSSDSTYNIAAGFTKIKNLKVLRNAGKGKKKAIKNGIEASSGSLIATTDADCRVGNNWLKTMVSLDVENKPEMIIGPVRLENGIGFFKRFQELEFMSLQGITAGTAIAGDPVMCNGANLAFSKKAYTEYAEDLHDELVSGDDVFLLHNIKRKPCNKIMWLESTDAMITTRVPDTIFSFTRQRARWISKAGSYSDRSTQVLAIVTFVTILVQFLLLICGLFRPELLLVFAALFVLKSIPDFLILSNTLRRYNETDLMKWFVISQLVYPVYVIAVVLCSPGTRYRGHISSPSPKGI
jgi:cellulose synthase/poly-beta-1,6-N-acetylglucosamine synthase-like glycosyltransferase